MSIRSLRTRLGLFWLLIVAICVSLGLIMLEVYRQGAGVQVDDGIRGTLRRDAYKQTWRAFSPSAFQSTQNKIRTATWGARLHSRLMHDGASVTFEDAILRYRGEANDVTTRFRRLRVNDRQAILEFLRSL